MLYLRPIINGTGNYYIEAETREQKRTDVIVDYRGEQYIIEMKIWHGQEYNTRGEKQLAEYLDAYHVNQGYMISFNFNQKKEIGVHEILIDDKKIIEKSSGIKNIAKPICSGFAIFFCNQPVSYDNIKV